MYEKKTYNVEEIDYNNLKAITESNVINTLEKIAKITKMDCWFGINENGKCIDLENNNRIIPIRKAINDLLEGLNKEDIKYLSNDEIYTLLNFINKL